MSCPNCNHYGRARIPVGKPLLGYRLVCHRCGIGFKIVDLIGCDLVAVTEIVE